MADFLNDSLIERSLSSLFARDDASGRVRLGTLVAIRWVAILGQLTAILVAHQGLGFPLPLGPVLGAVGASFLINLGAAALWPQSARLSDRGAALFLGYDVVQLAALLALTGGLGNPFSILLLVPVTISATLLRLSSTVVLCALVIGCASLTAFVHWPLPWAGAPVLLPTLYVVGLWTALVLGTVFLAVYAWRVAAEARRIEDALSATHLALDQEQRAAELGALAAAAAHELGTPLGTMTVVARELERGLEPGDPIADDIALLVSQSQRCREILTRLSRGDHVLDAPFESLSLSVLLELIVAPHRSERVDVVIDASFDETAPQIVEPQVHAVPEILHGLGNLVENAVQFAERQVEIKARWTAGEVRLEVLDDGPGFPHGMLTWLGEPYLSSRRESGRMGLGVFIAKTLLRRTGGHVGFANRHRKIGGARVTVTWPRARLEPQIESSNREAQTERT